MVNGVSAKNLDNRILAIRTQGCDLCLYENISDFETAYARQLMTIKEIVQALKDKGLTATKHKWYNHIKYHLNPEVSVVLSENAPNLAQEIVDKIGECAENIEILKDQGERLSLSLQNDPDPKTVKAWTGVITELRHWVELLAKLQGEFKEVNKITAKNINIQYNDTKEIILQEACPECKLKFADKLGPKILNTNEN